MGMATRSYASFDVEIRHPRLQIRLVWRSGNHSTPPGSPHLFLRSRAVESSPSLLDSPQSFDGTTDAAQALCWRPVVSSPNLPNSPQSFGVTTDAAQALSWRPLLSSPSLPDSPQSFDGTTDAAQASCWRPLFPELYLQARAPNTGPGAMTAHHPQ